MTNKINLRKSPRVCFLTGVLISLIGTATILYDVEIESRIFAVFIVVIGLLCIFYINKLTLDTYSGYLIHKHGFFIPFVKNRYRINKIKRIKISEKTVRRNNNNSSEIYPVDLIGIKDGIVLKHQDPWFSRSVAEKLAKLLHIPLDNRVYGKSSIRHPEELDLPLIERWKNNNVCFEKPKIPVKTDLVHKTSSTSFDIYVQSEHYLKKYAIAVLIILIATAALMYPFINEIWLFYWFFFGISIPFFCLATLAFCGKSHLNINTQSVSFRQGYAPIRYKAKIYAIEEFIVSGDGIYLVTDKKSIWMHWGTSLEDSEYLEAAIPYELFRLGQINTAETVHSSL